MSLSGLLPAVGEKKKGVKKKKAKGVTQVVDMSFLKEIGEEDEAEELERELQEKKRLREEDEGMEGKGTGLAALLPAPKRRHRNAEKSFDNVNPSKDAEFEIREGLNIEDNPPPLTEATILKPSKKKAKPQGLASLLAYDSDGPADDAPPAPEDPHPSPPNDIGAGAAQPRDSGVVDPPAVPQPTPTPRPTGPLKIKKTQFTFKNRKAAEGEPAQQETPEQAQAREQSEAKAKEEAEARAAWEKYYADMAEYQQRVQQEQDARMGVVDVHQDTLVPQQQQQQQPKAAPRNYSLTLGNAAQAPNHIMYLAQQAAASRDEVDAANERFRAVRNKGKAQYGF